MGSEWQQASLSTLGKIVTGKTPKTSDDGNFGEDVPFITPRDLKGNRKVITTERNLSYKGSKKVVNSIIPPNSVMVSCIGSDMGKSAISTFESVTNQQINSIVIEENNYYKFIYYNLSSRKDEIKGMASGSAQPILNKTDFGQIKINLPPLPEQKAIAHILGSLDDKIELNRQMNETLESMAQALFKSWFVDFDPVIDNALAAGNPIPDVFAERAEQRKQIKNMSKSGGVSFQTPKDNLHEHFPSEFEYTEEMGWIPKGWEVDSFSRLANLNPESWSKKNTPETVNYVDLANTKNGRINLIVPYSYIEAPSRARRILNVDDTIIGTVRPGNRSFAYIQINDLTGSTGFAVMRPKKKEYRSFLYLGLTQDETIDHFAHIADGGAYPAIRPEVVASHECIAPPDNLLNIFDDLVYPSLKKIGQNEKEGESLAKLRNTLLPKLLSGELRIPDAEKMTEDVA